MDAMLRVYLQKEIVPLKRVAPIPAEYNTRALLPQAHEFVLALVKPPADVSTTTILNICCKLGQTILFARFGRYCDAFSAPLRSIPNCLLLFWVFKAFSNCAFGRYVAQGSVDLEGK